MFSGKVLASEIHGQYSHDTQKNPLLCHSKYTTQANTVILTWYNFLFNFVSCQNDTHF